MNRQERRRRLAGSGFKLGDLRRMSERLAREGKAEAVVAKAASRLTPEEARKALAEWCARGGK